MIYGNDYTYALTNSPNVILRSDGAHIPVDTGNTDYLQYLQWLDDGNTPTPVPGINLPTLKDQLSDAIDALVADVYSGWTRFQQEYLNRENAATVYKANGYSGDPGIWVSSYAGAAGVSNRVAADIILGQANALNSALAGLAAQRMRKYEIASGTDATQVQVIYNDITQNIDSIAAQIE